MLLHFWFTVYGEILVWWVVDYIARWILVSIYGRLHLINGYSLVRSMVYDTEVLCIENISENYWIWTCDFTIVRRAVYSVLYYDILKMAFQCLILVCKLNAIKICILIHKIELFATMYVLIRLLAIWIIKKKLVYHEN